MNMTDEMARYAYECIDAYMRRLGRRPGKDTGDVRQCAIMNICKRMARFDETRAGWRTYISRVARFAVMDAMEKIGVQKMEECVDEFESNESITPDIPDTLTEVQVYIVRMIIEGHTISRLMAAAGMQRRRFEAERRGIRARWVR